LKTVDRYGIGKLLLGLNRSEEPFPVKHIRDVIWVVDKDNAIVFISQNVELITGYSAEEECAMSQQTQWVCRVHPEDVERYKISTKGLFEGKEPFNIEYRFKRKDAMWIWVHDRAMAIYREGSRRYACGLLSDITKRKQDGLRIKELKGKYESLIKNIPNVIYSCLLEETAPIIFISGRFKDWTGYSPEDFYSDSETWLRCIHPQDRNRAMKAFIQAYSKKTEYLAKYRIIHKDTGQGRWIMNHSVPIKDEKGKLARYDGIITDITEQEKLRENLHFYAMELTKAQEQERKRIALELHDDTVQVLFSLIADIDRITRGNKRLRKEDVLRLQQVQVNINLVMNELRQFSHELRPRLLDEFGLIPSLELLVEEVNRESRLNCRLQQSGHKLRIPLETELALFRITQEALRNIQKHSKATEAVVMIHFSRGQIELQIIDNGRGFEVPSAMSDFARISKLGLAGICERVRFLNGDFTVTSLVGKGTTINVLIPIAQA